MPTTVVSAASSNQYNFQTKIDNDIDTVTFTPLNSTKCITWKEALSVNYTDGGSVLKMAEREIPEFFRSASIHSFSLSLKSELQVELALKYSPSQSPKLQ